MQPSILIKREFTFSIVLFLRLLLNVYSYVMQEASYCRVLLYRRSVASIIIIRFYPTQLKTKFEKLRMQILKSTLHKFRFSQEFRNKHSRKKSVSSQRYNLFQQHQNDIFYYELEQFLMHFHSFHNQNLAQHTFLSKTINIYCL